VGGAVRLADFGLAKVLAASVASHTGSMSPNYVAPEVLDGHVSKHSDQYSLAVTYAQLRTGKLPFVGESVMQIIYAHVHKAPDLSGLPEAERPAVARALAKQPEERWPSCQAFVRALVGAVRNENGRLAPPGGSTRVPDAGATPMTRGFTGLPETQRPPPIPPTRIDDGRSSRLTAVATGLRRHWLWPFSLAVVLAGLAALLIAPRLRPEAGVNLLAKDEPPKLITNSIGMKLVLVPAGDFLMGSPDSDKEAQDDEKPQHRVRITRPFYLGAHEVTQGQYRAVTGASPSIFYGSDDLPVERVSWEDAIAFCNKLSEQMGLKPYYHSGARTPSGGDGYRLPTEAEWEYACRAGSATRYHFGDDAANLGAYDWYGDNSGHKTHPVGQKRPNAWGLYDMHGNVWEWCWDGFGRDFYARSPDADPTGPSQAVDRASRGGSWEDDLRICRSAVRYGSAPGNQRHDLGFRVARVPSGP
jgi:formylglycine-generating enzyme required for sulfatase activity